MRRPDRGAHSLLLTALRLAGLWAVAIVQPLLEVVGHAPEFSVAHRAGPADILLLLAALLLVPPLALGRCSGPPSSLVAHGDDRLGAGGATGGAGPEADGGYDVDRCRTPAAAAAAAATLSYARFAPFRSFLTALAAAILVVPVAFAQQPANASLTVRLIGRNPSAVRLKIARAVAPTTRLAVTANGCTL